MHFAADRFSALFLMAEWVEIVDAWQLKTEEDYRDVARLGRKAKFGGVLSLLLIIKTTCNQVGGHR